MYQQFILFLFAIIPSTSIFLQETIYCQTQYGGSQKIKEEFYTIQDNKNIKHGTYTSYYSNGQIKENGAYENNLKHSKWVIYKINGGIKELQYYEYGKKVGIWENYIENGLVIERFNHETKQSLDPIINMIIKYPPIARENQVQGVVEMQVYFDKECNVVKMNYIQSLGSGCDEEAKRSFERYMQLAKKYNAQIEGCEKGERLFKFSFKLE